LFGLVEWVQSEQYPWYRRKRWAFSSVVSKCDLSWFEEIFIAIFVVCFRNHIESNKIHLLLNFAKRILLIRCSTNRSLISAMRSRKTQVLSSSTTSTQLVLMSSNCKWLKLKHVRTCLYYDQAAGLLSSRLI
jgi:hypothetical protein